MKKNFLKFWGTRGSCAVSGPEYAHFGGNSCCLEVRYEGTLLIIDAGTGIRPLGETLAHEKKIDLFLGHTHWDHLIGLPFFEPLYNKDIAITIWSPETEGRSCRELIAQLFAKEFFPIPFNQVEKRLEFRTIREKHPLSFGPLLLDFHRTCHPGIALCFKITTPHETLSYVTDNEIDSPSPSFIDFHRKSSYFIHEAQYFSEEYEKKKGWGHSSLSRAIHLVNQVEPAHWLVTHHDPRHSDDALRALAQEARRSALPCSAQWLPDGYTLSLK